MQKFAQKCTLMINEKVTHEKIKCAHFQFIRSINKIQFIDHKIFDF